MAVPKKRTGHSAQGKRRSNWKATKPETTKCPNCGATVLAHTVCMACGQYKGKVASIKAEGYVESSLEKKAAKKPAKVKEEVVVEQPKAEEVVAEEVKTEEAPVEETAVVEEVKEEASEAEKTEE